MVVAYALAMVSVLTGFSPYRLSVVLVVPLGAMACGFAAVSGFYFAAKDEEELERPQPVLFVAMIAAACLAQMLIFVFEYFGAFIPTHSLAALMSFPDYIELTFTNAEVRMRGQDFEPESGGLAMALAFSQLVGFLLAAPITYKQIPGSGSFIDQ